MNVQALKRKVQDKTKPSYGRQFLSHNQGQNVATE